QLSAFTVLLLRNSVLPILKALTLPPFLESTSAVIIFICKVYIPFAFSAGLAYLGLSLNFKNIPVTNTTGMKMNFFIYLLYDYKFFGVYITICSQPCYIHACTNC